MSERSEAGYGYVAPGGSLAPCASSKRTGRQAGPPAQPARTQNLGCSVARIMQSPEEPEAQEGEGEEGRRRFLLGLFILYTQAQEPRSGEGTRLLYAHSSSPYIFLQPCERLHHNGEGGREASVMCRRSIRLRACPFVLLSVLVRGRCGRSPVQVVRAEQTCPAHCGATLHPPAIHALHF